MKWTEFMMILIGIYFAYYGLNLVFDLLNVKQPAGLRSEDDGVLHFTDDEPQLIIPAKEGPAIAATKEDTDTLPVDASASSNTATGGMLLSGAASLKQLFELAKDDLIEYTKAISY